jgi:hypothetical protein
MIIWTLECKEEGAECLQLTGAEAWITAYFCASNAGIP